MIEQLRVIIESPWNGDTEKNRAYLIECLQDSLDRNEAPFASHLFYTQFLDDTKEIDRILGMECGFCWMEAASLVAVYTDLGVSPGMSEGIRRAMTLGKIIEYRSIK